MPILVTLDQLTKLAPSIRSSYRDAFSRDGQAVLNQFGISANPLRVAHFMAQILHESGGLTIQFESLNYSPQRLPVVWPSRFQPKGPLNPNDFAHNEQKLGNSVYGNRMGNTAPNDGFTYRGRGLMQLTGKDSYREATQLLRQSIPDAPDFVQNPDLVISSEWCLRIAAGEWFSKNCNAKADANDLNAVTRAINGGLIGIAARADWLRRTQFIWR